MENPSLLGSVFNCLPSFPSRTRESYYQVNDPFAAARNLPVYTGPELSEKTFAVSNNAAAVPRYLPNNKFSVYNSPSGFQPSYSPPSSNLLRKPSNPLAPRPLRLVRASRKRKPPVFFAQNTHNVYQVITTLSIDTSSPNPDKMASNPIMPKLDDSASDLASSVDSRGRRRRRNNKALAPGGLGQPAVLPRLADTKPVRLQLGLNLDVEVELKARLQGDVSLTLLQ